MMQIVRFVCLISIIYFLNGFLNVADATPINASHKIQNTIYSISFNTDSLILTLLQDHH